MYNACCISMILIFKCKTHNINNLYNLYYTIILFILYKYYTIHFLWGKCGVILDKKKLNQQIFFYTLNHYRMTFMQLWNEIKLHKFEISLMPKTV